MKDFLVSLFRTCEKGDVANVLVTDVSGRYFKISRYSLTFGVGVSIWEEVPPGDSGDGKIDVDSLVNAIMIFKDGRVVVRKFPRKTDELTNQ